MDIIHFERLWSSKDGLQFRIRSICNDDEARLIRFHQSLSDRSVRMRYFYTFGIEQRTTHKRLLEVCNNDEAKGLALVAEYTDPTSKQREIGAIGRLIRLTKPYKAELAVLVRDSMQHQGLGTEIGRALITSAQELHVSQIVASCLSENADMQRLLARLGFTLSSVHGPDVVDAKLTLPAEVAMTVRR